MMMMMMMMTMTMTMTMTTTMTTTTTLLSLFFLFFFLFLLSNFLSPMAVSKVCELAGLRKFGSAEEKFGPLARGHGARKCALQTLPGGGGVPRLDRNFHVYFGYIYTVYDTVSLGDIYYCNFSLQTAYLFPTGFISCFLLHELDLSSDLEVHWPPWARLAS